MLTVITVYYFAIHFNSFCDLRTHIAVEVYGVQPQVPIPFFLIMCVTVAGLLLLVMFVFCIIDLRRRAKLTKAAEMDRIDDFDVKLIEYVTLMKSRLIISPFLSERVSVFCQEQTDWSVYMKCTII